jgi:hypothetical protein
MEDSLCIVQDSETDRNREVANMGNIYKYCAFTISAATCADSTDNVLKTPITREYIKQRCYTAGNRSGADLWAFASHDIQEWHERRNNRLRERAWALQEQVLSPRTDTWTLLQTVWSCCVSACSEENPTGTHREYDDKQIFSDLKNLCASEEHLSAVHGDRLKCYGKSTGQCMMDLWYRILRDFESRKITFEEDRLPALSGLAKEVARHIKDEYLAGIWRTDFQNGLLWSRSIPSDRKGVYVAPSWSSISSCCAAGTMSFACVTPNIQQGRLVSIAEVVQVDLECAGEDPFGRLLSGTLRLKAPAKKAKAFNQKQIRLSENYGSLRRRAVLATSTLLCLLDSQSLVESLVLDYRDAYLLLHKLDAVFIQIGRNELPPGSSKFDSQYGQTYALILEPVSKDSKEFQRIGFARIADDLVDGWETQVIPIS